MRCISCQFYEQHTKVGDVLDCMDAAPESLGKCRRNAPVISSTPDYGLQGVWPDVAGSDRCGEYAPNS